MGQNSKIEWCHHTFNAWRGCTKVSSGCKNCYAEKLSHRNPKSLGVWGDDGTRVVAADAAWREPLKWDRWASVGTCWACGGNVKATEPTCEKCNGTGTLFKAYRARVFCASLADVFEDRDELLAPRARLFALIDATPNLDWMLLTKRPENIRRFWIGGHRGNVWRGASVEDHKNADARIPELISTNDLSPIAFLSMEPLLGEIGIFGPCKYHGPVADDDDLIDCGACDGRGRSPLMELSDQIHLVIVGGESGPGARPLHPDWVRSLRDQCQASDVPFFFKQWGEFLPCESIPTSAWGSGREFKFDDGQQMLRVGKKAAGRLLDGREWNEMPVVEVTR